MTKSERNYIERLVRETNQRIKEVYDGTICNFMNHDQREGFIQGLSSALEPFATLVDLEVIEVNLNNIE